MKFIKTKIKDLRSQPEEYRVRVATRFTLIAGIIILILWLAVFLPLQIYLS